MTARRTSSVLFLFLVLALFPSYVEAQCVSLTTLGSPYNQDFNTLASTGTSSTVPAGWAFSEAGTNANTTYTAGTGSGTAGDTYSFGAAASSERAFGGLFSGSLTPTIGACFTNNTGVTVSNLTIAYTGEEWRLGFAARADQLDFEYSLDATSLTTGTWTAVNTLDFITPNTVAPAGAKDGNNATFRTAISSSISPLSIANGATVWIRWLDFNAANADDGLAVDDFSITPSVLDVAPSVLTTTPPNAATGVGLAANIDVTFSEPVNVAPGWFTISCTVSGLHAATESGGPTIFTLDPTINFVANEICTVTIDDAFVTDQDANDPPNNMAADFVWSFDTNPPPPLVVNEIDYDQVGGDAAEFVEIRNNGGAPVNLDPVAIELVNGNLGGAAVYLTIDLPNVNLAPGAYFVVCANNTTTPNCNLDVTPNTDLIQNGAPDAVAIRWNGVLVDTVSYEGDTGAPYTETSGSGLTDTNTDDFLGLSRLPDGTDTGVNNADLSERCITPGAANVATTTPCSPPAILGLAINDVTLSEGQAGPKTFTFTVSLDQPAPPGGVTFTIATADGTAEDDNPVTEDNDYVGQALGGQIIPEGDDEYTFDVIVNSDTGVEPDETFSVNITNVVGAPIGDPQGVGTIQNDDFGAITLIHDIQGPGATSPETGNVHTVHGIVTGVKSNGFFVQEEEADYDADDNTSEGIFVFTSSAPPAAAQMGNLVYVTGTVSEFAPASDPLQPVTELTSATTVLDATGLTLPAPEPLTPTFPDPAGPFDQLERVEGMRVSAASITVSGPSDGSINENANTGTSNGRFHGVITGVARPFREPGIQAPDVPPTGSIPPIPRWDFNPERLRIESATINSQPVLTVKSGDVVAPVIGPLDYGFRGYAIYPDGTAGTPIVTPGTLPTTVADPAGNEVTVATFNMFHFFDDVSSGDGSGTLTTVAYNNRLNKASIAIRNHLKFPDILGVQEFDSIDTLEDLADKINADAVANSQPDPMYTAHLMEGNDVGGIDVGYLVKTAPVIGGAARVSGVTVTQHGLNTTWIDPRDGSTDILHDRPSLVLEATVNRAPGASFPIVVVNNHLKSLIAIDDNTVNGATTEGDRNRQKRRTQAEDIATNLLAPRLATNANEHIVLIGDFNAFEFNDGYVDPIGIMSGTPTPDNETVCADDADVDLEPNFVNLVNTPPAAERYSYVFDGNAQNLDHVIVSAGVVADTTARRIERPRIDADYPETERNNNATPFRISDHEPTVGYLTVAALLVADVSITKTLDTAGPYFEGQSVTYTLDVANAGPDTATNIQVTDTPANLSITSVTGSGCAALPCTIASLGAGANTTITVTATIVAATMFDNSADANADEADPNSANNTDTTSNGGTAGATANISITKNLDTAGPYYAGNSVTYTITVANAGPSTATNIGVTDTPSNLTITNVSGACTSFSPCTIASLASGANTNITVTATIDAAAAFDNVVSASADEHDPDTADNTDNTGNGDTATSSADVSVTKTLDTLAPYTIGQSVTYTIVVANAGPSTATNINVTDAPTNLTITNVSGACASLPCSIASLASGASTNITVTATIDSSGAFSNTATANGDESDPDGSDNSSSDGDVASQTNVVDVTKTVSGTFVQGTNVTYTIVLTNNMTVNQPDNFGHEFTDGLPAGLTLLPGSFTATSGTTGSSSNIFFWDGAIPSGGTVTLTFDATIDPTATGTICNQGQSIFDKDGDNQNESSELTDDPSTGATNDSTCFTVLQANVVDVTKAVSGTFVQGTNVTYTIVMTNNMTVTQPDNFGHEFTDNLPAGLTLVPGSFTATSGTNGSVSNIFFWDGSIPSGGTVTLTFQATIGATATGQICNQGQSIFDKDGDAQNESSELTDDPSTGPANDATCFYVVQSNVVEVTKAVSGTFVQGTNVTYTIVMTNNMTVTQPDNFGHEFTDNLPAGLTLVPGSFTATSGTNGSVSNIFFWDGSIPSGGTVTLTFQATISPTATGQICNQGQSIFDRNGDGQNEAEEKTDDPSTAAVNDFTCFYVVQSNVVEVTKSVSGTFVQGTNVTYTIVMTNNMTVTQPDNFGHEFTDNLPAGLTLVPGSFTATSGTNGSVSNIFFWDGSIPSGGTVTLTFQATISPTATGQICNQGQSIFDRNGDGQNEAEEKTDDPSTAAVNDFTCFVVIANADTDGDGVNDTIEQAAPNGGDGNGDGIPDYQQSTVASIPAATGSGYLTLQSSCPLQEVYVTTPGALPSPDPGFHYPHGLIAFRAPCSSATFSLFVYGSGSVSSYRKYGPLPPGGPAQWYQLPGATFQVVTVGSLHPRRIDFSLTDGGTGDDTPVDGVIVDQGGPSDPALAIPTLDEIGLLALAAMLAAIALLVMKR